jgi:hypothetical protein
VIAQGGVTGPDIEASAVGPHKMKLDKLVKYLQTRVNGACPDGQLVQSIADDGSVTCAPAGAGTITGVTTSGGLTGGGNAGDVALGIDPSVIQSRVTQNCSGNHAVQSIGQNGGAGCGSFVTGVTGGTGLSGGTITDAGTLSVDPTAVQSRVSGTCAGNNAIQSVSQSGSVGCGAISASGAAGGDLTGTYPNPTLGNGSIDSVNLFSAGLQDGTAGTATLRSLGTGATQAAAGNDARLSDARTPTGSAGGDLTGTYPNPTIGAGKVDTSKFAVLPGGRIRQTGTCQTFTSGPFTEVRFDELQSGSGVSYDATGVGGMKLTTPGRYFVTAEVIWPNNGNGARGFDISLNGGEVAFDSSVAVPGTNSVSAATALIEAHANDVLTAVAGQSSGGDLTLDGSFGRCASLSAQWLGPLGP